MSFGSVAKQLFCPHCGSAFWSFLKDELEHFSKLAVDARKKFEEEKFNSYHKGICVPLNFGGANASKPVSEKSDKKENEDPFS